MENKNLPKSRTENPSAPTNKGSFVINVIKDDNKKERPVAPPKEPEGGDSGGWTINIFYTLLFAFLIFVFSLLIHKFNDALFSAF